MRSTTSKNFKNIQENKENLKKHYEKLELYIFSFFLQSYLHSKSRYNPLIKPGKKISKFEDSRFSIQHFQRCGLDITASKILFCLNIYIYIYIKNNFWKRKNI